MTMSGPTRPRCVRTGLHPPCSTRLRSSTSETSTISTTTDRRPSRNGSGATVVWSMLRFRVFVVRLTGRMPPIDLALSRMHYLGWPPGGPGGSRKNGAGRPIPVGRRPDSQGGRRYYCTAHGGYRPKWYRRLLEARPEIVADVQVQFAVSEFRGPREYIQLWELASRPAPRSGRSARELAPGPFRLLKLKQSKRIICCGLHFNTPACARLRPLVSEAGRRPGGHETEGLRNTCWNSPGNSHTDRSGNEGLSFELLEELLSTSATGQVRRLRTAAAISSEESVESASRSAAYSAARLWAGKPGQASRPIH